MSNQFPNPPTELSGVLRNLGFPAQVVRYINDQERLTTLQDLNQIGRDLLEPMFSAMRVRDPPIVYTTLQLSRFRTLHSYLRRMASQRTPINPAGINEALLVQELEFGDDPKHKEPDKKIPFPSEGFKKDTEWLSFRDLFKNYLDSVPSSKRSVPLSYVIRPDVAPPGVDADDPMWTVTHDGNAFRQDNRLVYTYLVTLTRNGPGKAIVDGFQLNPNGRAAFKALDSMFTGGAYKTLLLNKGLATLDSTKYLGLTNYTWSMFKNDMDEAFRQVDEAKGFAMDDPTKVYHFLKGVQAPFLSESVTIARQIYATNYKDACLHLANAVLTVTSRNDFQRGRPQRNVSGVFTGRYSHEDWSALSDAEKQEVRRIREQQQGNRGGRSDRGRGSHSGGRDGTKNLQGRSDGGRSGRGGGRGRGRVGARGRGAARNNIRQVQQVHQEPQDEPSDDDVDEDWEYEVDEAGEDEPVKPTRQPRKIPAGKFRRVNSAILVRRVGSVFSNEAGRCELDSHADNCVLGRDAVILEVYEGQKFQVYGYKKDIPVERFLCKACLAYDCPTTKKSYLLIIDQCFVDKELQSSLICPNQLRANGIIVEDVPIRFDKRSSHSIKIHNVVIQLLCKGYISYFNAREPLDDEIATLEYLELTGSHWDPHSEEHELEEKVASINSVNSSSTYSVDPNELAKLFMITKESAEDTLKCTTILASKIYNEPRYSSYGHRFRFLTRRHLKGNFYTDTFFSSVESMDGYRAAQLFINHYRYLHVVLMVSKGEAPTALRHFFDNVGLPDLIISDNASEQTSQAWKTALNEFKVLHRLTEPYKHHQNYAENGVKLVKFRCVKIMERKGVPGIFWDHTLEYMANLSNRIVHKTPRLEGRTPYEWVHGITPDISAFVTFGYYDYVFYATHNVKFPGPKRKIGRWLGPSKTIMCDLVFKILTVSGNIIHTSGVEPITREEIEMDSYKAMIQDYDRSLKNNLGLGPSDDDVESLFGLEGETSPPAVEIESSICSVRVHEDSGSSMTNDTEVSMDAGWELSKVRIPRGDGFRHGIVRRKKRDHNGDVVGNPSTNPILDTTIYEVEFDDGMLEEISGNIIAMAIYDSCDDEGYSKGLVLDEILDHFVSRKLTKFKTTRGWYLLVRWKDGSEDVTRLGELKESYPVEIAKYASENGLVGEDAFWWVPYTLKKADRILSKVKARNVRLEKFGVRIPRSVEEALAFDRASRTNYWRDAISKEMKNIEVAFKILEEGERAPVGYQFIKCHFIFDVKMDGTRKARYVAGGHMTETPSSVTYSSVISRDSIRILLVIAALNGLDVSSCDIQNAYINAKPREKVYFRAGKEFGDKRGRLIVIVRALYGLKSSGAAFRARLSQELREMGYKPSLADPDVYMKARARADGSNFYEYILCYVDDILCISDNPSLFMENLKNIFTLKNGYSTPKTFLGCEVQKFEVHENGQTFRSWGMGTGDYVKRVVDEAERRAHEYGFVFPTRVVAPMRTNYSPELDFTSFLDDDGVTWYQGLIGTLRWMIEIGRIDLAHSVSVLSCYMSMPRVGHLLEVLHVFAYLKVSSNFSLVLDHRDPMLKSNRSSHAAEWTDFYPGATEAIPGNMPEPRGLPVFTHCYVDADWAGNLLNRRSHTGLVIYVQSAPVIWVSKRQKTVETSTHGAELCATKMAVELIEGLRYKLRMFGVQLNGPTLVFCDNESVVHNLTKPESTLKKKHNSIAFHKTREAVASNTIEVHKIASKDNPSDLLTKVLSGIQTSYHSCNILLCNASNMQKN